MTAAAPRGARSRMALLVGFGLVLLGADVFTVRSTALLLLGTGLALVGALMVAVSSAGSTTVRGKLALAFAGSVLALLALALPALVIRLPRVVPDPRWEMFDPELGWANVTHDTVGGRFERIDPSREHVLVLGDSILLGHGVAHAETAASLLDRRLAPAWQVLNAAVSGYSIDQYALSLERLIPRTRPRLVVVGIFSGNDFEITAREYGWGHSKPFFVPSGDRLVPQHGTLGGHNCIDRMAQSLLFRALWADVDFAQSALDRFCGVRQLRVDQAEDAARLWFRRIDRVSRAAGARVLFVLLPELRTFPDAAGRMGDAAYHSRYLDLARLLHEAGVDAFEPAAGLVRSGVPLASLHLGDRTHFSVRGNEVLAQVLEPEIRARLPSP